MIWTIFCTCCGPDSVPATLVTDPSAATARTSTTLRWLGLSEAVLMSACDAALGGQRGRVDERHLVLDHRGEQPAQRRKAKHLNVFRCQLAADLHSERRWQFG